MNRQPILWQLRTSRLMMQARRLQPRSKRHEPIGDMLWVERMVERSGPQLNLAGVDLASTKAEFAELSDGAVNYSAVAHIASGIRANRSASDDIAARGISRGLGRKSWHEDGIAMKTVSS